MKMLTREQARSLAVRYQAYLQAHRDEEDGKPDANTGFWARMLRDSQLETGIVMMPYEVLAYHVDRKGIEPPASTPKAFDVDPLDPANPKELEA